MTRSRPPFPPRRLRPGAALAGCTLGLAALAGPLRAADPEPGPGAKASEPAPPPQAVEAIDQLQRELGAALREALARGPEHAIEVCRVRAPELAADASGPGLRVGRTSHKLRNPANAPEPWMEPLLDAYRRAEPAPGSFRSVDLGARGTGYVEPIYVQPLCLTCHGPQVEPALRETIREAYPEDEAVGFEAGAFRGLFWAVVAPAADG